MKAFVILSCFVAIAVARPEAGYAYNSPAPVYHQQAQHHVVSSGPNYNLGSSHDSGFTAGSSAFGSGSSSIGFGSGSSSVGFGSGSSSVGFGSGSSSAGFGSSGGFVQDVGFGSGGHLAVGGGAATTLVQKHIYVHVPPQEHEEVQHINHAAAPIQNQKHYKIIFIKAPSAPSYHRQIQAAVQGHTEEKTIVYVLSKKPQDLSEIIQASAPAPHIPSKPEVFFIKYKTHESGVASADAAHSVGAGDAGFVAGGDAGFVAGGDAGFVAGGDAGFVAGGDAGFVAGSAAHGGSDYTVDHSGGHGGHTVSAPAPVYGPAH